MKIDINYMKLAERFCWDGCRYNNTNPTCNSPAGQATPFIFITTWLSLNHPSPIAT